MRRLIAFILVIGLIIFSEWFSFRILNYFFDENILFKWIYNGLNVLVIVGFFSGVSQFRQRKEKRTFGYNFLIGSAFSILVSKWFFAISLGVLNFINFIGFQALKNVSNFSEMGFFIGDLNTRIWIALIVGLFILLSMLYGITFGKYNYDVTNIKVKIKDLPEKFKGFRIVQISDIHSGTFDSLRQVKKGIRKINEQDPDMVVFTGDLVNFDINEINPYISAFSEIKAKDGKYSILGNHDYYAFASRTEAGAKEKFSKFKDKHEQMGFQLLMNENVQIQKESDAINLIGVENWGAGPFPKYGDLRKSTQGLIPNVPNILLSHDPSHWDHEVIDHPHRMDLTLSGHTHGMQFGINLPFLKWSPVQYRYKNWMGMYDHKGQKLYVNRGFGFLGFPGRVFMWPEITVLELEQD